jgi:hypothetical protein
VGDTGFEPKTSTVCAQKERKAQNIREYQKYKGRPLLRADFSDFWIFDLFRYIRQIFGAVWAQL